MKRTDKAGHYLKKPVEENELFKNDPAESEEEGEYDSFNEDTMRSGPEVAGGIPVKDPKDDEKFFFDHEA